MEARQPLTDRQKKILDFLAEFIEKHHYPPSVRQIGDAVGLSSSSTVHAQLHNLETKGYIRRDPESARAIVLIETKKPARKPRPAPAALPTNIVSLPLLGTVAAGQPILAEQNIEDTLNLPTQIVGDSSSFLLTVRGESMVEAGILDGDYVVVKEQPTANNGEIVVALIDDEATVKTFYKETDRIRLQPENQSMDPIYVRDVTILGKVIALLRTL
ncbi:MAG: transcriptional repressor LexA [Coriobacteriales bacterium]|nr:transcriptional repressor LexA [Coriobacteriales bacterium]